MKLTIKLWKEDKFYIARIPELGVTTQGKTANEARENLREATQLHLQSMVDYMIEHGKVRIERGHIVQNNE